MPLPKASPTEFHALPSYIMRKAEPFVAVPPTHSWEASLFAAVSAVTGPGIAVAPAATLQFCAFASYVAKEMFPPLTDNDPPTMSELGLAHVIALATPARLLPGRLH